MNLFPTAHSMSSPELFDRQAATFDRRTGLPDSVTRGIAAEVIRVGAAEAGDLIVEIGAGSGQIGQWFNEPMRYVGVDYSAGMLSQFRRRLAPGRAFHRLVQADANASLPLAGNVARVIFSSRTMHLLELNRVCEEVFRIASITRATLILGRVERDLHSVRDRMAAQMNERLLEHGFEGKRSARESGQLLELCRSRGAEVLPQVSVATWRVSASPQQSLESWKAHDSLGGVLTPATVRAEILKEVEAWADAEFGSLDKEIESVESYVLKPVRLSPIT